MIELVIVRDPDGETYVSVFVDGVRTGDVKEYEVDAGRGHTWDDWLESRDWCIYAASSLAVREAVIDAFDDPPGGKYVQRPPGADWLEDLPAVADA